MQLYKTTAIDNADEQEDIITWHGSADAASKGRTAAKSDGFKATTEAANVPTHKVGLLAWLNKNVNR